MTHINQNPKTPLRKKRATKNQLLQIQDFELDIEQDFRNIYDRLPRSGIHRIDAAWPLVNTYMSIT